MKMTNENLYKLCKKYGTQVLESRRKFAGLLPEVLKRGLYKKKGFGSIYHFAAVLAGMSKEQVQRAIQLERKFEGKPALKKALVNGEISMNKLARVASIATKENQEELAAKAQILPKRALETFVRDVKYESEKGGTKPLFGGNSVPGHKTRSKAKCPAELRRSETVSDSEHKNRIELSEEVNKKLGELQAKGIDINELLLELLQKREQGIVEEKEEISEELSKEVNIKDAGINKNLKKPSTYINVRIKRILKKEHGTKCSIQNCKKPATQIHHTQRFSISKNHNPFYLAPLCKDHHQIAHTVDTKYQEKLRL